IKAKTSSCVGAFFDDARAFGPELFVGPEARRAQERGEARRFSSPESAAGLSEDRLRGAFDARCAAAEIGLLQPHAQQLAIVEALFELTGDDEAPELPAHRSPALLSQHRGGHL